MAKAGIYVHVPFCARKCPYCDFYSRAYDAQAVALYLDAVARQIESLPRGLATDTVYFGGGTPSLLGAEQLAALLERLTARVALDSNPEITLELNPATCGPGKLRDLRAAGLNRLSVGVQSTDAAVLRAAGRLHNPQEALETLESARGAGFENLSADLMLGLPADTPQTLSRSLDEVSARVDHISAYLLKVMPGTPFARALPAPIPDEDEMAARYLGAVEQLAARGFAQYEISNFARGPAFRSRHNLKYWDCGTWYGLGPAAHSSVAGRLWSFPRDLDRFCAVFEPGFDASLGFTAPLEAESDVDADDFIMLRLRTAEGLSLRELNDRFQLCFGESKLRFVQQLVRGHYAQFDGDVLRLTPRGMLVSNSIIVELL